MAFECSPNSCPICEVIFVAHKKAENYDLRLMQQVVFIEPICRGLQPTAACKAKGQERKGRRKSNEIPRISVGCVG